MSQPPEMRIWITFHELTGLPKPTKQDFRAAISQFPTSTVLVGVARLSILFNLGPDANTVANPEKTALFAPKMFHPNLAWRVSQFVQTGRPMFFQAQLRYLAAEAMRIDPQPPENDRTLPDSVLGPILLAAGDCLHKPHVQVTDDLDAIANIVADFLPTYEIDAMNDGFILFLRCHIYLKIVIPRLPKNVKRFDIPALFEKALGFPLKLYTLFLYTFTMHAMEERTQLQGNAVPGDGGLPITWFSKTSLTTEQVSAMFDTVSCSLTDFPDKKALHGFADFEFLKDHPFFRINDKLYCLDYEFACAKLESGVLWRVARSLPSKERLAYFGFWGEIFEEYAHWLFETYADKTKNTYYPRPLYPEDKEARPICDGIMMCGTTAVLIEAKLGTCPAEVRYSGDYAKFRGYLEDKLVSGTDRNIGVAQLLTAVRNITSFPSDKLPEYLHGVKEIMPLLITKDDIGSSWMTNRYLNVRFQQQRTEEEKQKGDVSPLVSLSIGTLERMMGALEKMTLSDILHQRISEDPDLGRPFEAASDYVPRGTPKMVWKHVEIMQDLTKELAADFNMTE